MTVLAHFAAGHWWEIVIYLAPLLVVGGTILWQIWRDRRGEGAEDPAAAAIDRARSKKRGRG